MLQYIIPGNNNHGNRQYGPDAVTGCQIESRAFQSRWPVTRELKSIIAEPDAQTGLFRDFTLSVTAAQRMPAH